jgi:hypothetical protein
MDACAYDFETVTSRQKRIVLDILNAHWMSHPVFWSMSKTERTLYFGPCRVSSARVLRLIFWDDHSSAPSHSPFFCDLHCHVFITLCLTTPGAHVSGCLRRPALMLRTSLTFEILIRHSQKFPTRLQTRAGSLSSVTARRWQSTKQPTLKQRLSELIPEHQKYVRGS